jgi:hypothetical protein
MKKEGIIIVFLIILLFFSGCTERTLFSKEKTDSDQDGYPDETDLYPNDPDRWNLSHNIPPVAIITGPDVNISREHPTYFFGNESYDPDGKIIKYYWRFCNESDEVKSSGNGLVISLARCHSIEPNLRLKNFIPPFDYNISLTVALHLMFVLHLKSLFCT